MPIYLGVDQSLTATGFAIYLEQKSLILTYCFRAEANDRADYLSLYRRILQIKLQLLKTIQVAELIKEVDAVFIEEAMKSSIRQGQGNNETTRTLAKLECSLVIACLEKGIPPILMSAGNAKASWNRRLGAAKPKDEWKAKIEEWDPSWLPPVTTPDEIDAIGVLWGGLVSLKLKQPQELVSNEICRVKFSRNKTDIGSEFIRILRERSERFITEDELQQVRGVQGVSA